MGYHALGCRSMRSAKKYLRHNFVRDALLAALETDLEIETTETPESERFNEIRVADGLKAALAWRATQLPK